MPKISIVLPTYNGEKYISKSIDSILHQTFTDWELIIVNDCSTDHTQEIIDRYLKKDNRIKELTNTENIKLPQSLNRGFSVATGEYLTWTSDDNIYKLNALERMVNYLNRNRVPMVCAGMDVIDSDGRVLYKYEGYDEKNFLLHNCVGACFLYKRSVLRDIGEYSKKKFLVEDYDYWIRIFLNYGKIGYISDSLYCYRIHDSSLTEKRKDEIYKCQLKLKKEYAKNIIFQLKDEKQMLCQLYYELKMEHLLNEEEMKLFWKYIPELEREANVNREKKIIIYGAGKYGEKAYKKYSNIAYYADRNEIKVGEKINGIEVLSIKDMIRLKDKYQIMIASNPTEIYSFICILRDNNVNEYRIFYPDSV